MTNTATRMLVPISRKRLRLKKPPVPAAVTAPSGFDGGAGASPPPDTEEGGTSWSSVGGVEASSGFCCVVGSSSGFPGLMFNFYRFEVVEKDLYIDMIRRDSQYPVVDCCAFSTQIYDVFCKACRSESPTAKLKCQYLDKTLCPRCANKYPVEKNKGISGLQTPRHLKAGNS